VLAPAAEILERVAACKTATATDTLPQVAELKVESDDMAGFRESVRRKSDSPASTPRRDC
jgi:hypothetical protein